MFEVSVTTKKGSKVNSFLWEGKECQIGRSKSNDIVLHGWRVNGIHAVLSCSDHGPFVRATPDSRSILVNKERRAEYGPITEADKLEIGDYILRIKYNKSNEGGVSDRGFMSAPCGEEAPDFSEESLFNSKPSGAVVPSHLDPFDGMEAGDALDAGTPESSYTEEQRAAIKKWRSKIHRELFYILDLRRVNINDMKDEELKKFTGETINEVMKKQEDIPSFIDPEQLAKEVLAEAIGLGPLEHLLEDDRISEVMVNSCDEIFYEESGRLKKSSITFTDNNSVVSAIERIVTPLGRRIDESSPMVDARLKDGSRVNAIIPPLALKGPCITIRKFAKTQLTSNDLIRFGSLDSNMVEFLNTSILRKRNVVISGGTGSGKTTLLNVLSNFIPKDERIITVEDAAELSLHQPNLVSLEARPSNQEGKGAVEIRDLVRNCLRMRPDRIVVGECRGGEALDMLQAMNTGHDGSLTTVHSNSPRDCISRLEVLVLMSGMELPVRAIREQIASAVNIIVQQTRFPCGSRRITNISEITGVEGDTIQMSEIFKFQQSGYDESGRVAGDFCATGQIPEFYEELRQRGMEVDLSIFSGRQSD